MKQSEKQQSQTKMPFSFFLSAKSFLKRFWGFFATGIALILGAGLLYERKKASEVDQKKDSGTSSINHTNDVIDQVQAASEDARHEHEENQNIHEEIVKNVEKQYQENKKDLDEKKKKEIEKIAQDYSKNPEELAKKLSELTGFKVILPEE